MTYIADTKINNLNIRFQPKDISVFKKAQRHSRIVHKLKIILPVSAFLIGAAFVWYTVLETPPHNAKVEITQIGEAGKIVMNTPDLVGYTRDNKRYVMTASKATQDTKNEGIVTLENIHADIPFKEEDRATVIAKDGIFNNENKIISLNNDITIESKEINFIANFENLNINTVSNYISSNKPVNIINDKTHIKAGDMKISENGKNIVFSNKVRVEIK